MAYLALLKWGGIQELYECVFESGEEKFDNFKLTREARSWAGSFEDPHPRNLTIGCIETDVRHIQFYCWRPRPGLHPECYSTSFQVWGKMVPAEMPIGLDEFARVRFSDEELALLRSEYRSVSFPN